MSNVTEKQKGAAKTARAFGKSTIPIVPAERLQKPAWIRVKMGDSRRFQEIKDVLRSHQLHTVCEEASCPNIGECFSEDTATFRGIGRSAYAGAALSATSRTAQPRNRPALR